MSIKQLSLSSFRNLKDDTLDLHPTVNLIHGRNASGKTGFLEAISVITQGKSFRTHRLNRCITQGHSSFLIFARFDGYRCGFRYGPANQEIRLDGERLNGIRQLADRSALLVLDTQSLELITGKPERRRQFIDWLLFHVEPGYADLWNRCHRILKQRNAILRARKQLDQLKYWDNELVRASEDIDQLRRHVTEGVLSSLKNGTVRYSSGFAKDYEHQLIDTRETDIRLGYTRYHFNRADLQFIGAHEAPMSESSSRGQIKSFAVDLYMQAIEYIRSNTQKPVIILADDLAAELDAYNLSKLYQRMLTLDAQLFVTALDTNDFPDSLTDQCRMFHVEHGMMGSGSN